MTRSQNQALNSLKDIVTLCQDGMGGTQPIFATSEDDSHVFLYWTRFIPETVTDVRGAVRIGKRGACSFLVWNSWTGETETTPFGNYITKNVIRAEGAYATVMDKEGR